jgi:hypothetical protein
VEWKGESEREGRQGKGRETGNREERLVKGKRDSEREGRQ